MPYQWDTLAHAEGWITHTGNLKKLVTPESNHGENVMKDMLQGSFK